MVVVLIGVDGLRVLLALVDSGADLLDPLGQARAEPARGGERGRGLVGAQQAGDVDGGDVLVRERGGDRTGLGVTERGQPRPG